MLANMCDVRCIDIVYTAIGNNITTICVSIISVTTRMDNYATKKIAIKSCHSLSYTISISMFKSVVATHILYQLTQLDIDESSKPSNKEMNYSPNI
jgi:hypothetical protein